MPNIFTSGTPMLGFSASDPLNFFIGWSPSYLYPLHGLGWSMVDDPTFSTLQETTPSAREVRIPLYTNPLHNWKLVFNYLFNDPNTIIAGNTDTDMRMLYSFYTSMAGKGGEFLYKPRESDVDAQPLLLPDTNGYVELVYSLGPFFAESVQEYAYPVITLTTLSPYSATNITSNCTFYAAGSIAPYSGAAFHIGTLSPPVSFGANDVLTADFDLFYRCRFTDDKLSFEEFQYRIMKTGVGITQVRI